MQSLHDILYSGELGHSAFVWNELTMVISNESTFTYPSSFPLLVIPNWYVTFSLLLTGEQSTFTTRTCLSYAKLNSLIKAGWKGWTLVDYEEE